MMLMLILMLRTLLLRLLLLLLLLVLLLLLGLLPVSRGSCVLPGVEVSSSRGRNCLSSLRAEGLGRS